jgi:hypothetical protein
MKFKVHNIPAHLILSVWHMYYKGGWGVSEREKRSTEEKKVASLCALKAYIWGVEV